MVSPLRGEKPQNRPVSKLNTGRFAFVARNAAGKKTTALEYIVQTMSLLPFLVPLGTTVCFTAFRHPKSVQIFMELMHRPWKQCRQNVPFL